MTNKELNKQLAETTGLSTIEVAELQATCAELIIQHVAQGNTVAFSGFGTFEQKEKPERKMYNPTTKETIVIPARMSLGFRPRGSFKERINSTEYV